MSLGVIWLFSIVCTNGLPFITKTFWVIAQFSRGSMFPSSRRKHKGKKLDLMTAMAAGDEAVGKKGARSLESG